MLDTVALRCTSSTAFGSHSVASHTEKKKKYSVTIDNFGNNTCTCIAFVMKRNKMGGLSAIGDPELTCKHIQALLAVRGGCGWSSLLVDEEAKFGKVCPRCYNDTEEYDTRNPEDVDLEELMADFLAISKKLGR